MITPTGGGRVGGSQQSDVGFIKGNPVLPVLKSLRAEVRHNVMPQYHAAARKKFITQRDDLRAAKGAIDQLSDLQVQGNKIKYNRDIPEIKPPLRDIKQIEHLGIEKVRRAMLEAPIGDRKITYLYKEHESNRYPEIWKEISIKEALTNGIPVKDLKTGNDIIQKISDHNFPNHFQILQLLSTATNDRQQDMWIMNNFKLKLNVRRDKNPGEPFTEVVNALTKLNTEAMLPETTVVDWKKFAEEIKKIKENLEKLKPGIRDEYTRGKVQSVIDRINNSFDTKFPGRDTKIHEEDAAKLWLLDQQHEGVEVRNSANPNEKIKLPPKTAERRARQSEMDAAGLAINMNRETTQADLTDTTGLLTQMNHGFISILENEFDKLKKIADKMKTK